ncbi:MAG TPA: 50S ribosomal protein L32, partial [Firmicutes bacterium]|nr:50S ribosomal protein L32 [Bacillota bacterium]
PKRKTSKTRQAKRRSQWKLTGPNLIACPQCHELKLPHRVCPNCGFYKDKAVIAQE